MEAQPYLYVRPLDGIKRFGYDIFNGKTFEAIIIFFSFYYICLLSFYKDDAHPQYFQVVRISSLILAFLLNLECFLKLMCLTWKGFISSKWNIIELITIAIFDITLLFTEFLLEILEIENNSLILRILWISRMIIFLRIYQKFYFFRKLLRVLKFSLSLYVNLAFLFILTIFIYGLLGYVMYSSLASGQMIDQNLNFQNILFSMFILLKIAIYDDWSIIVFDCFQFNAICGKSQNMMCKTSKFLKFNAINFHNFCSFVIYLFHFIFNDHQIYYNKHDCFSHITTI